MEECDTIGSYAMLLRECARSRDVEGGIRLHATMREQGADKAKLLQDLLVQMYGKCGRIERAAQVFESIHQPDTTSYNIMIAAFASNGRLDDARDTFHRNPRKDTVSWNTLIAATARAGDPSDALQLLDQMPRAIRDVVSWNTIICALGRAGHGRRALQLLARMEEEAMARPNAVTYLGAAEACARLRDLEAGKSIHARVVAEGFDRDRKLGNALINMFGKCRSVKDARAVFDAMRERDSVSWNAIISAYAQNGHLETAMAIFFREMPPGERNVVSWNVIICGCAQAGVAEIALDLFDEMREQGFAADDVTFLAALDACSLLQDLATAKWIHSAILEKSEGALPSLKVANALITMYGKCGSPRDAWSAFKLQYCQGMSDIVSWNSMVAALAHNGKVTEARALFDQMPLRDIVSWNTMIAALAQNGLPGESISLFNSMTAPPNAITFVSAVDACAALGAIEQGRGIHRRAAAAGCDSEINVQNALITMYGKCGSAEEALLVYKAMRELDLVSWNGMLAAYAHSGRLGEAEALFSEVPELDAITWNTMISCMARWGASRAALRLAAVMDLEAVAADEITAIAVLDACSNLADVSIARDVHESCGNDATMKVRNALIKLYGRCKLVDEARSVFDAMMEWDLVSWTSMVGAYSLVGDVTAAKACFDAMAEHDVTAWNALVAAYIQNGFGSEALASFKLMEASGVEANEITLTSIPDACSQAADARFVQGRVESSGIRSSLIDTAQVRMLGRCCGASIAKQVFDRVVDRGIYSWNAMAAANAQKGHHVLEQLVMEMSVEGVLPNEVTFLLLLSSSSHGGRVWDITRQFARMEHEFWVQPGVDHFCCVVDVLARSGKLREAEELVSTMWFEPDAETWMAFGGGCRLHGQVERGALAAHLALELDPLCSSPFVLASNLYSSSWSEWKSQNHSRTSVYAQTKV